jgi:2-C-methyl-D-erythritol 4-phosphate cytidylyltransferase
VLVVPQESIGEATRIAGGNDSVVVAPGGASRQESVANGLELVRSDVVVVHDAARPLATPELVRAVLAPLDGTEGAVAAVPVDETLKLVESGRVSATVDRTGLWRVQTPQAFDAARLRAAHGSAARDGFDATDDAQLIERQGGRVVVVEGSRRNIKITYPEDFELAEALLEPCH